MWLRKTRYSLIEVWLITLLTGLPSATREDIVDAAKRANADGFIQEMEHGYDTLIGERGAMLSGGMAQRITIARALLKIHPYLY